MTYSIGESSSMAGRRRGYDHATTDSEYNHREAVIVS